MKQDLTEIVLIVDRSGSMESIKADAEGGINTFITEQKAAEGKANFTLCQFDTHYEFVHQGVDIEKVDNYKLVPRGWTALNDAIGRTINEVGERLAKTPEEERPALVLFMIVTDGHENSSQEFSGEKVKEMIAHQKEKYNWKFTFLGTEEDSLQVGASLGLVGTSARIGKGKMGDAYLMNSSKFTNLRSMSANRANQAEMSAALAYNDEELATLESSS